MVNSGRRNPTPVYIFSLPRSGSTLLQRILAAHPRVATGSEPWFMLPLFYGQREAGVAAEYSHSSCVRAYHHFAGDSAKARWRRAAAAFSRQIYSEVSTEEAVFFVDKTPRYHLIVDDVIAAMKQAKFIFLWRSPLAVAASMIDTWGRGAFNVVRYRLDLYRGLANLVQAYREHADRCETVRYEDLVSEPEGELARICRYLELEYRDTMLSSFQDVELSGPMGDPKRASSERVDATRAEGWQDTFRNPIRRTWAQRYVQWIGSERLSVMGYSRQRIEEALSRPTMHGRKIGRDLLLLLKDSVKAVLDPVVVRGKMRRPVWQHWIEYS